MIQRDISDHELGDFCVNPNGSGGVGEPEPAAGGRTFFRNRTSEDDILAGVACSDGKNRFLFPFRIPALHFAGWSACRAKKEQAREEADAETSHQQN